MSVIGAPDTDNGAFVVVVQYDRDRSRRRIYLSLSAAENAALRAQKAGRDVSVQLAVLQPLVGGERR